MWHPVVYFLVFIQQLWASTEQTGQDSHIKGPPDHTLFKEIHDQPGNFFFPRRACITNNVWIVDHALRSTVSRLWNMTVNQLATEEGLRLFHIWDGWFSPKFKAVTVMVNCIVLFCSFLQMISYWWFWYLPFLDQCIC